MKKKKTITAVVLSAVFLIGTLALTAGLFKTDPVAAAFKELTTGETTGDTIRAKVEAMGSAIFVENGFELTDFKQVTDGSRDDVPKGGQGSYSETGLYTGSEAIDYFGKPIVGPATLAACLQETKDSSDKYITDTTYWLVYKILVPFYYQINSGIDPATGKITKSTEIRMGQVGEYILLYVSPETGLYVAVRCACGNIQFMFPTKTTGETTTGEETTTEEKTTVPETTTPGTTTKPFKDPSKDPVNQGNAPIGGGVNATTGPGAEHNETSHAPSETRVNPPAPTRPTTTAAQTTTTKPATTSSTTSGSTATTKPVTTTEKQTIYTDPTPPPTTESGVHPEPVTGETPIPGMN